MQDPRDFDPGMEVTTNGVAYRRLGAGEPLILMHGGAGSWVHWIQNVNTLSRHFAVHAIDQPSYGDSATLPWEIDVEDYLTEVLDAVRDMIEDAPRVHIAGFSFGGYLAAQTAVRLGPRAASLSMIGGAGYGKPVGRGFTLGSKRRLTEALGRAPTCQELMDMHRDNLGKLMIHDAALIDDWMVRMQRRNVERTRFDSRRLSWADGVPDLIAELGCPVMVVYGEHDAAAIPPVAERFARCRAARPDVQTHLLADCGHWAMYEAADETNALMIDFHGRSA